MASSEMRGFVFAIVFIVTFTALLNTIPAGFQGPEETPNDIIPIDPNLLSGFSESENYTRAVMDPLTYGYTLPAGGRDWIVTDGTTKIYLAAKVYYFGWFWFGGLDNCRFTGPNRIDRGTSLELTEITADATDGVVTYSLMLTQSGESAGSFVCWWNTTEYATATLAWASDEVYLVHGIGFSDTARLDAAGLLLSILFLQLPEVPTLVNIFLALPPWACIVYVIWFIIKESLPFV